MRLTLGTVAAVTLLGLTATSTAWSNCPTPADDANRFNIDSSNQGQIYDAELKITWSRCSIGQVWNGSACQGAEMVTQWPAAKQHEGNGWRLPTTVELTSLLDACVAPHINTRIFPGIYGKGGTAGYWSGESAGSVATTVNHDKGTVAAVPVTHVHTARLVKDGAATSGEQQVGSR